MREKLIQGLIMATVTIVVVAAAWIVNASVCHAKWGQSGMACRWRPIAGCQVNDHGAWIPAEHYRATR